MLSWRPKSDMTKILGIVNITPDSFWSGSRINNPDALVERVRQMIADGADAIDIGGCSTRPGCTFASEEQEMERLSWGLEVLREEFPELLISVDTFRPRIAERCVKEWNVTCINDTLGGDPDMYDTVARTGAVYLLTYAEQVVADVMKEAENFFHDRLEQLAKCGVSVSDKVILDPGFGFGKTLEQHYTMLANMSDLKKFGLPILAGLSRKSMAFKLLGITPEEALNATTVMNTIALERGADWLRVHDVLEAAEAVKIVNAVKENK